MTTDATPSFEESLANLESLVEQLESGNLTLEQSVETFRKASELADRCQQQLLDARLRVTELTPVQGGLLPNDGMFDDGEL